MKPSSRVKSSTEARATYDKVIEIFFYFRPVKDLDEVVHPKFLGYGTAAHEFFKDREALRKMAVMQAEQLRDTQFTLTRKPVIGKFLTNDSTFLILEDFELHLQDNDHTLQLRLSTILEKESDKWVITHFHGSTPDKDIDKEEAFPMEGLRKKNAELEAKIKERTRDLEIEAALERVRSRSMGMQKSEELKDVVKVIFDQLAHLNINAEHAGIVVDYEPKKDWHFWIAETQDIPSKVTVPYLDLIWDRQFTEAKKKGKDFFTTLMDFEEKNSFYKVLLPHVEGLTKKVKDFYFSCPGLAISTAIEKDIGLYIENFSGTPYSSEENEILRRFAKVFQQTYTRFLDLKKAEAQAREAQIETALERVRSRSMAMHKSEELADLSLELVKQVQALGVDTWFCAFNIYDDDSKGSLEWGSNGQGTFPKYRTPREGIFLRYYEAGQRGETLLINEIGEDECPAHYDYLCTLPGVGEQLLKMKDEGIPFPTSQIDHVAFFKYGYVLFITYEPSPESHEIFKRFAKVFEQTYTRFLDLQKAEAQAKEAQIEAALEKVRSSMMAMHKTEELHLVLKTLFEQMQSLGLEVQGSAIIIYDENLAAEHWMIGFSGEFPESYKLPYSEHPYCADMVKAWQKGVPFQEFFFEGELKVEYGKWALENSDFKHMPPEFKKEMLDPARLVLSEVFNKYGMLEIMGHEPLQKETVDILKRFSKVFEQAYTRFLDLQKAEARIREAQIEAALEKVRSRTMAMHKSKELHKVVLTVSQEIRNLGLNISAAHIYRFEEGDKGINMWIAGDGGLYPNEVYFPYFKHEFFDGIYHARTTNKTFFTMLGTSKKEKNRLYRHLLNSSKIEISEDRKKYVLDAKSWAGIVALGKYSGIGVLRLIEEVEEEFSVEEYEILKRLSKVFEQAYIRFLDLQRAEAQTREAQIEAALERVRSKTMAMHNSQDVAATVVTLFDEVQKLGLDESIRCGIGILEGNEKMETWSVNATPEGKVDLKLGMLDMSIHPLLVGVKNAWKTRKKGYSYELKNEDVRNYYSKLNEEPEYSFNVNLDSVPDRIYHRISVFSAGVLFAFAENPFSEEASKILDRFAGVFGQTYRRYLDLLKAEKQAREAQIEASLERIRARAMAMHHTDELTDVLGVLFDQFDFLGINPVLTHLTLFDEANETFTLRITTGGKKRVIAEQLIDVNAVESWKASFANWKKSELHAVDFIEYPPEVLPAVWELLDEVMSALPDENKIYPEDFPEGLFTTQGHCKYGYIGFNHRRKATEEEVEIVIRFAKEFGRLYQRFLDIQKAEIQARDALKQATLDRVRGQIASMRSTEDLERITPLVWNELKALGIPFIRCGVFIIDESSKTVQAFLSAPDGHSLGVMKIPFDAEKVTAATVANWKKKEVYKTHWDKDQFLEFMQLMKDLGQVSNEKEYQGAEQPPESLHLHFVPFTQGMLYVGNVGPLEAEQIELIQTLADAFAIAYARYEDFVKLEKAKEQVENTLEELKATQNQLVQSEKMASLGELTAGIAHEIQNPLNFVNNFSEVSVELLEEMLEEMSKGDLEEAKALMEDIKQNLDKINHHGKRADGIVKGMLQHSRTSSGEKELTDLNVLADEYLRLAYHGLRAKDKTFNATLETHFDESIGKVNILAQDMGRVILNLITNAFYAVKEKSSFANSSKEASAKSEASEDDTYKPTVTVSTKKKKNSVEICVKDNGNGIPEPIKEKIFQPFFTTKPTGQGTGLGLSMSYDIVTKGHGGSLKVETEEGKGTTFCINLPVIK